MCESSQIAAGESAAVSLERPFVLGAVVLAAGRSSRMGQPKLLLPWRDTSILGYLLRQWRLLGAIQIGVVYARGDCLVQAELRRLNEAPSDLIVNPAPDRGMFSSIQCAAGWDRWSGGLTHWAILLGDQPHLQTTTLRKLVSFCSANPHQICQPSNKGRRRHPVVVPKAVFMSLPGSSAGTFREFLTGCEVAVCELPDAGLDLDIDRPEDYALARQRDEGSGRDLST